MIYQINLNENLGGHTLSDEEIQKYINKIKEGYDLQNFGSDITVMADVLSTLDNFSGDAYTEEIIEITKGMLYFLKDLIPIKSEVADLFSKIDIF